MPCQRQFDKVLVRASECVCCRFNFGSSSKVGSKLKHISDLTSVTDFHDRHVSFSGTLLNRVHTPANLRPRFTHTLHKGYGHTALKKVLGLFSVKLCQACGLYSKQSNDVNERQDDKKGLVFASLPVADAIVEKPIQNSVPLNVKLCIYVSFIAGAGASLFSSLPSSPSSMTLRHKTLDNLCPRGTRHSFSTQSENLEKAHCRRLLAKCLTAANRYLKQTTSRMEHHTHTNAHRHRPTWMDNGYGLWLCTRNENIRFLLIFSRPFRLTLTPLYKAALE